MKTIAAFVQDPLVIRNMSDDKIHMIARKLKGRRSRSPSAGSSYNHYVREQMANLASDEATRGLTPQEKFRTIGRRWTTRDNPHKCAAPLKRAMTEKLCPQCPTDRSADGWRHVSWMRTDGRVVSPTLSPLSPTGAASPSTPRPPPSSPVSPTSPTDVSKLQPHHKTPHRPAVMYVADAESGSTSVVQTTRQRCPSDFTVYCKTGPQKKYCVRDVEDCAKSNEVMRLHNRQRRRCSNHGTGDVCERP